MAFAVCIFLLLVGVTVSAGWFSNWCERHLIAEDPYQYEHLTVDQLVSVYHRHKNEKFHSKALIIEIKIRLNNVELSYEDREILSKTIAGEK